MVTTLRIATRKSALALAQTALVEQRLQAALPGLTITRVPILTEGDKATDMPLTAIGGKGLFVKALEKALLEGRADIAVHSIKDMTVDIPGGLVLAAVCERADPRDVLVSNVYKNIMALPKRATVGTTSLRRQYQLHALRRDVEVVALRGNVDTRLAKLDTGEFDAIILAAAGLIRLGRAARITRYLDMPDFLPASGQGAVGIECRADDAAIIRSLVAQLDHAPSHQCVLAERAVTRGLGGSCLVPVAAHATWHEDNAASPQLSITGQVGRLDGVEVLASRITGEASEADALGSAVADALLAQGAQAIIQDYL
jgi:hydroxymethylbilane synthase